jgi:predicted RNA-binding protein with PIN domain
MPLVVDAYNVLHVTGVLSPDLAGGDLAELAALIATSRYRRDSTLLACDGVRTPAAAKVREPLVKVAFAGGGRTADEFIARFARASSAPRSLTVVSSDRTVLKVARRRGCETLTSERFLAQLEADRRSFRGPSAPGKPAGDGMSRAALEEWMTTFGVDEQTLAIPAVRPALPPNPPPPRDDSSAPRAALPRSPALPPEVDRLLDGLDLDRLLAGTPPPRDGDRTPRPTRASRDRARKRRGRRREGE